MGKDRVIYREETITEFRGNPLIEALPERYDSATVINKIMNRPEYSPELRNLPTQDRLMYTQTILNVYQPFERDMEIYNSICRCIYWGYVSRNPLTSVYVSDTNQEYKAVREASSYIAYQPFHAAVTGFAIIGISGLGKSTAIRAILSAFPCVIQHNRYHRKALRETQIVWMHLDCPNDGSLKGLCGAFFKRLDELIGTDYEEQYVSRRATLNDMSIAMSRLVRKYHVGVLVIDEIQSLVVSKDSTVPQKTLNFLINLVNTIGVPVILVGTPRALSFLQKEFQQAKRASGQGDFLWERMENNTDWKMFLDSIWQYQYTRNAISLTPEMSNILYQESLGIPFLAVHIYKLVQEYAIVSGKESFTVKDIQYVIKQRLRLTSPMREALKSGEDINIAQYLDLTPFTPGDFRKASVSSPGIPPEKAFQGAAEKSTISQSAISTLIGLGLSSCEASKWVQITMAQHTEMVEATALAREAYASYSAACQKQEERDLPDQKEASPTVETGYEQNEQKGIVGL